jgi:hypothetical protein
MGVTRKARVMFTCEHEVKDELSEWAESENRTVSNLIETLVQEALAVRKQQSTTPAFGTSSGGKKRKKGGEE